MSRDLVVRKRYARALFEAARERQQIAEVGEGLELVSSVLDTDEEFRRVWEYPGISSDAKKQLAREAFEGRIPELALNAILLTIDKRREAILPDLAEGYREIADEALGRATAVVYSPKPLTEEERREVAETFGKLTGKQMNVENIVKPELLGGIQVRIGDRLYDGSLAGKLQRLQKSLSQQAM
jgi:F-type H+-transporting ATPase subunit delta